jgi:hypothetical protein
MAALSVEATRHRHRIAKRQSFTKLGGACRPSARARNGCSITAEHGKANGVTQVMRFPLRALRAMKALVRPSRPLNDGFSVTRTRYVTSSEWPLEGREWASVAVYEFTTASDNRLCYRQGALEPEGHF